mgnify:CR=1 FL=1
MIYGRDFEGDTIDLESITGEMGEVIIVDRLWMWKHVRSVMKNNPDISGNRFY